MRAVVCRRDISGFGVGQSLHGTDGDFERDPSERAFAACSLEPSGRTGYPISGYLVRTRLEDPGSIASVCRSASAIAALQCWRQLLACDAAIVAGILMVRRSAGPTKKMPPVPVEK